MFDTSHDPIDIQFEAMDRLRHMINTVRRLGMNESALATLATLNGEGKPAIHSIEIATILDLGPVFFCHEDSEAYEQITGHPQVALCFKGPHKPQQICIEGAVRLLTNEEAEVIWHRLQDPAYAILRPTKVKALLLEPLRLDFSIEQPTVRASREIYAQGPNNQWQKQARDLVRVA